MKTKKAKKDFDVARDIVVARILTQMEQGIVPWRKPWFGLSRCYNYVTGYAYNIINEMMLDEPGGYVSWNMLKKLDGALKDGEKWDDRKRYIVKCWVKHIPVKDEDGNPVYNDDGEQKTRAIKGLKYETVVNVKYTTLPAKKRAKRLSPARSRTADTIIKEYLKMSGVKLTHRKGDRAFYSPAVDKVTVPKPEQFKDSAEYYSTVFHELGHSTGHPTRNHRFEVNDPKNMFGSESYAREELVAEFTASILNNYTGVGNDHSLKNSTAYLQNWSRAIKDDPKMFTVACYDADKASRLIIGGKLERVAEATEFEAE